MFSIIIPTMQKDVQILNKLLDELVMDETVGEIIIIDNSTKGFSYNSKKIKIILPKKNLFVNNAWNLGIKEAKFEYFGILNDDILLPLNFCKSVFDFLKNNENTGLVGLDSDFIQNFEKEDFNFYPSSGEISFSPINKTMYTEFWGSAFFGHKKNYYKIPKRIKIWCGDNFLLKMNNKKKINYEAKGAQIKHLKSLTCANPLFDKIKEKDIYNYSKIDPAFKKHPSYKNRFYNIFRWEKTYHHLIYTIFGTIKLKFKITQ